MGTDDQGKQGPPSAASVAEGKKKSNGALTSVVCLLLMLGAAKLYMAKLVHDELSEFAKEPPSYHVVEGGDLESYVSMVDEQRSKADALVAEFLDNDENDDESPAKSYPARAVEAKKVLDELIALPVPQQARDHHEALVHLTWVYQQLLEFMPNYGSSSFLLKDTQEKRLEFLAIAFKDQTAKTDKERERLQKILDGDS